MEQRLYDMGVRNRLYSYFLVETRGIYKKTFEAVAEKRLFSLMIDSGAFTVHKQGETVDIVKYADWLISMGDKIDVPINLDVIPEGPELVEKAAEQGWENQRYLESRGIKALPVYHAGESTKWFEKYIDSYEYIGLSKTGNLLTRSQQLIWLDTCWKRLVDDKGRPIRRIHGFGITNPEISSRYPWYSCDSSTWGQMGIYGRILVPSKNIYTKPIYGGIYVSKFHPSQRKKYVHYSGLADLEKKVVEAYATSMGVNINDLLNEDRAEARDAINIRYFLELEKRLSSKEQILGLQPCIWSKEDEW